MKPDQQRVSNVVMETVIRLCESGLEGSTARVQGVIAVTVDDSDVFVIHINDVVCNLSAHNIQDMSSLPMSSPAVSTSTTDCSSARKRARHRLVFQSPDSSRHRSTELAGSQHESELGCNESSQRHVDSKMCHSALVRQSQTCDVKPPAAKRSVVIVDSDDEDLKVVVKQSTSQRAVCQETLMTSVDSKNCVETAKDGSTVSSFHALRSVDTVSRCDTVKGPDAVRGGVSMVMDADADIMRSAGEVTDTVGGLCISDVVGSVQSWYNNAPVTAGMSPAGIKGDLCLNTYQGDDDDDEVMMMEEEGYNETTARWAKATPPSHLKRTLSSHSQHAQLPRRPASVSAAAALYQVKSGSVPSTPTHHNHRVPTPSSRTPTLKMRGDERPAGQDVKSTPEHRAVPSAGMTAQSPVSYKTMYVCNIGECSRGFAYKKNLITHQLSKHGYY